MKIIITNSLKIFLLCLILHFLYHILKMPILRIFLPTKENIFEYIKLLFTANILFSLFKKDSNKYLKALLQGILSNTILLVFYTTIFLKTGKLLPLTLSIFLLISILISEFFNSKIKIYPKKVEYYSIFMILTIYYIFLYLTDYPLNNLIFKDFF